MLDKKSCEVLIYSLVLSHLDYANGNLYGAATTLAEKNAKNSKLCG